MPLIDRPLLRRDLTLLPEILASSLHAAMPLPLRMAVSQAALTSQLSAACSRLAESPDADLVPLIDALGKELGAIRMARAPIDQAYLEAVPGLREALNRTIRRLA